MLLQLEKRYKKVKLPEMPPKKWFGNTDPEFVNERAKYVSQSALFCARAHHYVAGKSLRLTSRLLAGS